MDTPAVTPTPAAQPAQNGFDVQGARSAGYSDDEILSHLTTSRSFDVDGAAKAGYSKADIIDHLSSTPTPSATTGQAAPADKPGLMDTISNKLEAVSNQPLTSHAAAWEAGAANIGQGVVQAAKGVADTFQPPQDGTEKTIHATLGPAGLLTYRLGKGLIGSAKSATDVPAAIKDINASSDPVGTYANVAAKTAGHAGGQAAVALATAGAGKAISAVNTLRAIPEAISTDTIATLNNVATKEGLPVSTATTARDAATDLSQNFIKRAKATYKPVDDAVGGDLKPVQEKIGQLESAIEKNLNVDPDKAAKFTEDLGKQRETLKGLVERAKQNGVPNAEDIMKAGDKDYSRGMAMKEVQKGVATASGQVKMNGHPNPGGFASQIDMFERKGILQRALGQDGTDALIQNAKIGLARGKTLANVKSAAVGTAKYAGIPAGAAVGYGVFKALSGK